MTGWLRTHPRWQRVLAVGLTGLLAGGLLYFSAPRTIAAFSSLPGNPVLVRIQNVQRVSVKSLRTLIETRKRALRWLGSGRTYTDLGLAQLLLTQELAGDGDLDRMRLEETTDSLRAGLTRGPARPHAWTRLAYAEYLAEGASPRMAQALEMAITTAPFEPRLLFTRLELSLVAWPYFADEGRRLTGDQVRLAWRRSRDRLVELARHTHREDVVRVALSGSAEDLARFEARLAGGG